MENQDIVKDLHPGMLVAIKGPSFPQVGTAVAIPSNPAMNTSFDVQWMQQERAPHKPKR